LEVTPDPLKCLRPPTNQFELVPNRYFSPPYQWSTRSNRVSTGKCFPSGPFLFHARRLLKFPNSYPSRASFNFPPPSLLPPPFPTAPLPTSRQGLPQKCSTQRSFFVPNEPVFLPRSCPPVCPRAPGNPIISARPS